MTAHAAGGDRVTVRVPGFLRDVVPAASVQVAPGSLADVIAALDLAHPGIAQRLLDDSGLRRGVNVYVGSADVRYGDGLATAVPAAATVTILPVA